MSSRLAEVLVWEVESNAHPILSRLAWLHATSSELCHRPAHPGSTLTDPDTYHPCLLLPLSLPTVPAKVAAASWCQTASCRKRRW